MECYIYKKVIKFDFNLTIMLCRCDSRTALKQHICMYGALHSHAFP